MLNDTQLYKINFIVEEIGTAEENNLVLDAPTKKKEIETRGLLFFS